MDDKRPPLAERAEVILDLLVHRRRVALALQRHAEQSGRLVDDEHGLVLEDDVEIADPGLGPAPLRAARTVHPDTDGLARGERAGRIRDRGFAAVQENLAPFQPGEGFRPRSEPIRVRQVLIEP